MSYDWDWFTAGPIERVSDVKFSEWVTDNEETLWQDFLTWLNDPDYKDVKIDEGNRLYKQFISWASDQWDSMEHP